MKRRLGNGLLIASLVVGLVLPGILMLADFSQVSAQETAFVDLMKLQVGGEPGIEWEFELDPAYGPTGVFTLEDGDVRNFPILAGVGYTLTETPVEGYVTTYTVNGGAPQAGNSVTIGPLDADDWIVIDFINTFEEIPPATYTISGRITKDGNPLPGVSVTGSMVNPWTDTDTTDAEGKYELKGVPFAATSITITPTLANHVFSPASIQLPGPVEEDVPDQDFTATSDVTPPITVGWDSHSVDKAAVLAPWLALLPAIMVGVTVIVLRRQGRASEHP